MHEHFESQMHVLDSKIEEKTINNLLCIDCCPVHPKNLRLLADELYKQITAFGLSNSHIQVLLYK